MGAKQLKPTKADIESQLVDFLKKKMPEADTVNPGLESKLTELGVVSLDFLDVIFEVEEFYDISIEYSENLNHVTTIGDLVDQVSKIVEASHG